MHLSYSTAFKPGLHITFLVPATHRRLIGDFEFFNGNTSFQLPATHRRHRKVETCSTFFHLGAGDLDKLIWKHDCGRLPVGRQQFQKFDWLQYY